MSAADQPEDFRWRYHRDTKGKCSKWVARDRFGRTHWVTKFDARQLCVIGYAGERKAWKVQKPSAARDAVERMVRRSLVTTPDTVRKRIG